MELNDVEQIAEMIYNAFPAYMHTDWITFNIQKEASPLWKNGKCFKTKDVRCMHCVKKGYNEIAKIFIKEFKARYENDFTNEWKRLKKGEVRKMNFSTFLSLEKVQISKIILDLCGEFRLEKYCSLITMEKKLRKKNNK